MENDIKTSEKCSKKDQKEHFDISFITKDNTSSQGKTEQNGTQDSTILGEQSSKKTVGYTTLLAVVCLTISLCQIVCEMIGLEAITSVIVDIVATVISIFICLGVVRLDNNKELDTSIKDLVKKDIEDNLKINSEQNTTSKKK